MLTVISKIVKRGRKTLLSNTKQTYMPASGLYTIYAISTMKQLLLVEITHTHRHAITMIMCLSSNQHKGTTAILNHQLHQRMANLLTFLFKAIYTLPFHIYVL